METKKVTRNQAEEMMNRVRIDGEILTLSSLSQDELIELGWYFEPDEVHANFQLTYRNGQFNLGAVADTNDTYTVAHDTSIFGGYEGIMDIIEIGDPTFDYRWVAEYGTVGLKKC